MIQRWYTDIKVISTAAADLFTWPETPVILVAVYIPPQAAANEAAQQPAAHIMQLENSYSDSTILFLGNFNHVDMRRTLPRFKQKIKVLTRFNKILYQCYSVFPNAFHSVSWAPLGQSDHTLIFLIPGYRSKSKCIIPIK